MGLSAKQGAKAILRITLDAMNAVMGKAHSPHAARRLVTIYRPDLGSMLLSETGPEN